MKTDPSTPTRVIDSPTLAVILAIVAAAIVLVILAFSNPSDDQPLGQVSFNIAPPASASATTAAKASTRKLDLISVATQTQGAQARPHTSVPANGSDERWNADDSAAGTTPDAAH